VEAGPVETVWRSQDRQLGNADRASRFPGLQALGLAGEVASTFGAPQGAKGCAEPRGAHLCPTLHLPGKCCLCAWLPRALGTLQNAGEGPCPSERPGRV